MTSGELTLVDTILNTFTEIALPGYLVIDPERQIRLEEHMTVGGGGAIYTATLTDPALKEENGGDALVAVKQVQFLNNLSDEENMLLFKQEVAAMRFSLLFPPSFYHFQSFFPQSSLFLSFSLSFFPVL